MTQNLETYVKSKRLKTFTFLLLSKFFLTKQNFGLEFFRAVKKLRSFLSEHYYLL